MGFLKIFKIECTRGVLATGIRHKQPACVIAVMKYSRSKMRPFVQTMNAADAAFIQKTCAEFSRLAEAFFPVA
jgi:hypothetical protein